MRARHRIAMVGLVALSFALPGLAAERFRFVVFPFEPAQGSGVTRERALRVEQEFELGLQRKASMDVYSPDNFIPVQVAMAARALKVDEVTYAEHGVALNAPLALKIVEAVSYSRDNRYDAGVWGVCSQTDGGPVTGDGDSGDTDLAPLRAGETLTVHVVDRVSRLHHERTFTNDKGDMIGSAVVYAAGIVAELREKGLALEGASETGTEAVPVPGDGGGATEPGDGGDPVEPPVELTNNDAHAILARAAELERQGLFREALEEVKPLVGRAGLDEDALWNAAWSAYQFHDRLGETEEALRMLDAAERVATLDQLGLVSAARNRLKVAGTVDRRRIEDLKVRAIAWLKSHLLANPDDMEARVALAEKYMEQQPLPNWAKALEELDDRVRVVHPWDPRVLTDTCHCLLALGRAQRAAQLLDEWRDKQPATFGEDALLLLLRARLEGATPASAFEALRDLVGVREEPLRTGAVDMPGIATAAETAVSGCAERLVTVITDARRLIGGSARVERSRLEMRQEADALVADLATAGRILDRIETPEAWGEWRGALVRCVSVYAQAATELRYALDWNSRDACARAAGFYTTGTELGQGAMQGHPVGDVPAEPETSAPEVVGPL